VPDPADTLNRLREERRKFLRLHYDGQISADPFGEEEGRLSSRITAMESADTVSAEERQWAEAVEAFERIAAYLAGDDVAEPWDLATEDERRVLIDRCLTASNEGAHATSRPERRDGRSRPLIVFRACGKVTA
jgi:hypothetical protein